jgi:hypothetical protein
MGEEGNTIYIGTKQERVIDCLEHAKKSEKEGQNKRRVEGLRFLSWECLVVGIDSGFSLFIKIILIFSQIFFFILLLTRAVIEPNRIEL